MPWGTPEETGTESDEEPFSSVQSACRVARWEEEKKIFRKGILGEESWRDKRVV